MEYHVQWCVGGCGRALEDPVSRDKVAWFEHVFDTRLLTPANLLESPSLWPKSGSEDETVLLLCLPTPRKLWSTNPLELFRERRIARPAVLGAQSTPSIETRVFWDVFKVCGVGLDAF